ncbi:hypothetical protein BH23CHL8_BH23CHL8_24570 [soil metagenome]
MTPWIGSDRDDYAPGGYVILTSGDWQPGESVHLFVNDDEGRTWNRDVAVTADDEGFFQDEFVLPPWFVATYTAVATGDFSGVARVTFADSVGAGAPGAPTNANGSTISMTAPAVSAGDILVAQIVVAHDIATTFVCPPSGWLTNTTGAENLVVRDNLNRVMVQAFYRVATSNAVATEYSWNFKSNATSCGTVSNNQNEGASGGIVPFSGVDNGDPIEAVGRTSPGSASATASFPSVTTTTDGAGILRLLGVSTNNSSANTTPGANKLFHQNSSGGGARAVTMWGTTQTTAGPTGTFSASFDSAEWATMTIALRAAATNVAPTCASVSLSTNEDTTGSTAPSCTDADGDTLTYAIVSQAAYGTASVVSGQLQYVPNANFFGSDSFTYRANDGDVNSNTATVTVTVNAVNDAPSFTKGANVTVNEDSGAYSQAGGRPASRRARRTSRDRPSRSLSRTTRTPRSSRSLRPSARAAR